MEELTLVITPLFPICDSAAWNPFPYDPYHWSILDVLTDLADAAEINLYQLHLIA